MARWPGWTRESRPGDKLAGSWRHQRSGWRVRHCGHPTAIWPYHAEDERGRLVVHASGRGFRNLAQALGAVEQFHAGQVVLVQPEAGPFRIVSRSEAGRIVQRAAQQELF